MKLFDKRPLCLACSTAVILSFAFIYAGIYAVIGAAACAAAAGIVFLILKTKAKRTVLTVCAAVLVMCAVFSVYLTGVNSVSVGKTLHVSGYVLPDSENSYTRIYKITKAGGKPINIKAIAYTDGESCPDFAGFEADVSLEKYKGYIDENKIYSKTQSICKRW